MTNNPAFDLLMWARGPGFEYALIIFIAGPYIRVTEILVLGRKKDVAPAKGNPVGQGFKTIFTRMLPKPGMLTQAPVTHIGGYIFHLGFFFTFLFFAPHIELIDDLIGLRWPGASTVIVESVTAVTVVALVALLITRLNDPVRRALTSFEDYLVWLLSLLPLVTGYIAVNKLFGDYQLMLALHILSVEALMVVFPFSKLMHAVTFVLARYYNGAIQGRKGAES